MNGALKTAEQIKRDLSSAIAAEQMFRPTAGDAKLIRCFDRGFASWGFDFIRHALLFHQVMALARLWDSHIGVGSIPALAARLKEERLVNLIISRERRMVEETVELETLLGSGTSVRQAAERDAAQRGANLRKQIADVLGRVKKAKGSSELARLRKYRHEILAHSAAPEHSRLKKIKMPFYGDERKVLSKTVPIVSSLYQIVTGIHHDFKSTFSVWERYSDDTWAMVQAAAEGRRYDPPKVTAAELFKNAPASLTIKG